MYILRKRCLRKRMPENMKVSTESGKLTAMTSEAAKERRRRQQTGFRFRVMAFTDSSWQSTTMSNCHTVSEECFTQACARLLQNRQFFTQNRDLLQQLSLMRKSESRFSALLTRGRWRGSRRRTSSRLYRLPSTEYNSQSGRRAALPMLPVNWASSKVSFAFQDDQ